MCNNIMQIIKAENYQQLAILGANIIADQVKDKPNSVLGLATGSSPVGIYEKLVELYQKEHIDFSQVKTVNLDEYCSLSPSDPQSYHYFMEQHLFRYLNIKKENTHIPNGLEGDPQKACDDYNQLLESLGSVDLQLLGIGLNGHIGFNEPGEEFTNQTHCVDLSPITIAANARFFEDESLVPRKAYTMGIKSILHAEKILLIAAGEDKAEILKKALQGPITPQVPASILQLHKQVIVLCDQGAYSKLEESL
jgi:glucosamine-6-phosphate deaminase